MEYSLSAEQRSIFMTFFLKEKERIILYLKKASTFNNKFEQINYRIDLKSASKSNQGMK